MGVGEDAGKKDEIREFLQRVTSGQGFIEDIWIEREIREPGSEGSFNQAKSLSGKPVLNITQLLRSDIEHTFDNSLFAFRFIAANPGSGKTTLLNYLHELVEVEPNYRKYAVIINFPFNELLSDGSGEGFGAKFYQHVLDQTFWTLLKDNTNLSETVRSAAEDYLVKTIGREKLAQIKDKTESEILFTNQLNVFLSEFKVNRKRFFFDVLKSVLCAESQTTFVYLIDELDALHSHDSYLHDARSVVRDLINEAVSIQKLRLMVYIVGRLDDVDLFIKGDDALYSRVFNSVITLVSYRKDECEKIKSRIEERIEGAYSGCKDFDKAWLEIKQINLEPTYHYKSLREFCKLYSQRVLEVHEKYFKFFDKPFNRFERKARQLIESEAIKGWKNFLGDSLEEVNSVERRTGHLGHNKWKKYKGKGRYTLLVAQSTTHLSGHNVDCYVELKHGDNIVARAYGEAKNYPLCQSHIDTFQDWLSELKYNPDSVNGTPRDLAFVFSPSCTALQKRKLEIKKIEFIETEKIHDDETDEETRIDSVDETIENNGNVSSSSRVTESNPVVNLSTASRELIEKVLKGTRIHKTTIEKIVQYQPYSSLNDLAKEVGLSKSMKEKLKVKIDNNEICF